MCLVEILRCFARCSSHDSCAFPSRRRVAPTAARRKVAFGPARRKIAFGPARGLLHVLEAVALASAAVVPNMLPNDAPTAAQEALCEGGWRFFLSMYVLE